MTRNEFLKTDEMTKNRKQIISSAVACYILAAISIGANYILNGTLDILDPIILVVFGLLIQLLQSRVAAILLTVYSVINVVYMTITMGQLAGWWVCVVGVYAVIYTFKFQKAWKEYKKSPEAQIVE